MKKRNIGKYCYLHDFKERLYGFGLIRELFHQMGFHFRFTRNYCVLSFIFALADHNGVKMWIKFLKLQLSFSDLVKGDSQETVLVDLTYVVKAWTEENSK